ncbi:MAG: NERD domain-containing protein [Gammaproteobacteria bacterium]|nr:NERD domain-containing protein [Gammaproteobacteria bacterium]
MDALLDSIVNIPRDGWFLSAAAVVIVAPWLLRAPLRRYLDARRIRRAIRSLGAKVASDVVIPDGLDGTVNIDYLVMTPAYLLVVLVRRYPGAIFGAEKIDQWAQVMRKGSYKFANPLTELQDIVAVVRNQLPSVPVKGAVLFDQDSVFPKGKPDGVLHLPDIDAETKHTPLSDVPDELQRAWSTLCPGQ